MVTKFHEIGLDQVGIEYGSFDLLRQFNLARRHQDEPDNTGVTYALLSIHNARMLLRVHPDHVVDCHLNNINRARDGIGFLNDDHFWQKEAEGKLEENFLRCDLKKEEGEVELANAILHTYAVCEAIREVADTCIPQRSASDIRKPSNHKLSK
jgi:hypothetical protein